jgi:kinesin family protein 11
MAAEIEELKSQLHAAREKNGIFLPPETHSHMVATLESQKTMLAEREALLASKVKEFEALQQLFSRKESDLKEEADRHVMTHAKLGETKERLRRTTEDLNETRCSLDAKSAALTEFVAAEEALYEGACCLSERLHSALSDVDGLHEKIGENRDAAHHRHSHSMPTL